MRVPIENKGQMPIYVAGAMIPPGEIRLFEEDQLPPEFRAPAEVPVVEEVDPLLVILALSVDKVANGLPDLADAELDRLEMLEAEGKARKGVIAAITEERLRRAEVAVNAGNGE